MLRCDICDNTVEGTHCPVCDPKLGPTETIPTDPFKECLMVSTGLGPTGWEVRLSFATEEQALAAHEKTGSLVAAARGHEALLDVKLKQ